MNFEIVSRIAYFFKFRIGELVSLSLIVVSLFLIEISKTIFLYSSFSFNGDEKLDTL